MENNIQTNFNRYKQYSTNLRRYYRMPLVKTSLTTALSLGIVAFFITVALRPTLVTITELKQTIKESEGTLKKLQTKVTALEKISNMQSQFAPYIPLIDNSIPQDGPRYQVMAGELEVIAKESNVLIASSNQGEALTYSKIVDPYSGKNRTVVSMPVNFRISGTYTDILTFFDKLTTIDRLIAVTSISFTREVQTKDAKGLISFNVTGEAHYVANESLLTGALPGMKAKQSQVKVKEESADVPEN